MWTHAADALMHEQAIWIAGHVSITASHLFWLLFISPCHGSCLFWLLCVNTRKEDRDVQISSGSCASRERAVTSSKKNNTRKLSANYLYRFNSWLISSSVRNIVSVFATAKQLMFLWFQLYSNSRLFTTKYKLCYKKWYKFYRSARGSARYALVCCYISCPMEAWNEWTL